MMKNMKWFVMAVLLVSIAFGQYKGEQETLLQGKLHLGGFGAPVIKFTQMNDNFAVLVGGRGGLILNQRLVIGGGGYGLVNDVPVEISPDSTRYIDFGYGGMELGWVFASNRLVHLDLSTLFAAGGIGYRDAIFKDWDSDWNNDFYADSHIDAVFILEPTLNVELNITRFVRLDVGASYRYIYGIDDEILDAAKLSGATVNLALKFGAF